MSKKSIMKDEEGMMIDDSGNESALTVSADSAETFGSRSISFDEIIAKVQAASVGTIKILDTTKDLISLFATVTYGVSETLKANGIGVTTEPTPGTPDGVLVATTRSLTAETIAARALGMIYEENAERNAE